MPRTTEYRQWTDEEVKQLRQWTSEGVSFPEQARRLGRPIGAVHNKTTKLGLALGVAATERAKAEAQNGDSEVFSPYTDKPMSVDDIIALFKIDTTIFEPVAVIPNSWEIGAKHPVSGAILKRRLYQTKVRFRRVASQAIEKLRAELLADIAAESKRRAKLVRPITPKRGSADDDPHALEIAIYDIHFGKLAHAEESGSDYDSAIAETRVRAALEDLLYQARCYNIAQIYAVVGNDLTNVDNGSRTTTGGTPQDTDTRYYKTFRRARATMSWLIDRCASVAPVYVPIVPGNHDELTAWTIGQVLEAEFKHDARVSFDTSPRLRKYANFGANLIGWTHGCDEPHNTLPQIMAIEQPERWSTTTHREWHTGHRHATRATQPIMVEDKSGVTVRIIRGLTKTDAWHVRRGYVGAEQGAEAFVWRKSGGLRAHLFHTAR